MACFAKHLAVLAGILIVVTFPAASTEENHSDNNAFDRVLEMLNVSGNALPKSKVDQLFAGIANHVSCAESGKPVPGFEAETVENTCTQKLCLNTTDIFRLVGASSDPNVDLDEPKFLAAALSALYALSRGQHPCRATLSPGAGGATLGDVETKMAAALGDVTANVTEATLKLDAFLVNLGKTYQGSSAEHDHHDDHHDEAPAVIEEKCLSADAVLYHFDQQPPSLSRAAALRHTSAFILNLMYQGSQMEETCRLLPPGSRFVNDLIFKLEGHRGELSRTGFRRLMLDFEALPKTAKATEDHHDHRRKRSVAASAASNMPAGSAAPLRCYSPPELLASFGAGQRGSEISPDQLTELSPALLYQKLFADCSTPSNETTSSDNETWKRWVYGSVTVMAVCLTSLGGVIVLPCMGNRAYTLTMAAFLGLGVGSLAGDTLLHLIPAVLGAHKHEHGHDHGGEIKIEKHVYYALLNLAGLYVFFLLETCFVRLVKTKKGGNPVLSKHNSLNGAEFDSIDKSKPITKYGATDKADAETGKLKNPSVCVMIILGDALHNFVDGLAIGAAFSAGNSVGIATGIAIFCHELPHELGDFAVLLNNGMSIKRALFWNFVSALTAMIGLFVSLAVTTSDDVKNWIFALASGLFLYIALTDILPQMINAENIHDRAVYFMNNLGILLGFGIMFLIAVFEEHITI